MKIWPKTTGALCANSHPGSYTGQDAFNNMLPVIKVEDDEKRGLLGRIGCNGNTDCEKRGGGQRMPDKENFNAVIQEEQEKKYVLRRLTPVECCRLQGFPDWWEDGVEGSDSARYKMWGNGIALPCAVDVLFRIAYRRVL